MKKFYNLSIILVVFLFWGCATHKVRFNPENNIQGSSNSKKIEKTIFLVGDAGGAKLGESTDALKGFNSFISERNTKDDMVIFLGDNIYEKGLPSKNSEERALAEHKIDVQIDAVKDFFGA